MRIDLSALFHRASKDLTDGGHVRIPPDADTWPAEWKTISYKSYAQMPRIELSSGAAHADLFEMIKKRHSARMFTGEPLTNDQLSQLLRYSCGIVRRSVAGSPSRAQPSGGERFPIEMYMIVFSGSPEVPAGVYHYNVHDHALEILSNRSFSAQEKSGLLGYSWTKDISCALVMTAVFDRSSSKYGMRAYRYALIESGHIGQNIYLISESLGLGCCALGATRDEAIERLLDIDGIHESLVNTLVLGQVPA